jgi:hypothetical protein
MERPGQARRDSLHHGGQVPDSGGVPAWSLYRPEPSPIPVLIAAPHGGRCYPDSLCAAMRNPGPVTQRLEDRYVDKLAEAVADQTGAALLVAHAPRAMIDLNRGIEDIDWEMLRQQAREEGACRQDPSRRARSGLGLVPRRLSGIGELWKEKIGLDELEARIAGVHRPYHEVLDDTLGRIRRRWGAALLLDLPATGRLPLPRSTGLRRGGSRWHTTGPMPAAMRWTGMARRGRESMRCNWKCAARAILMRDWRNRPGASYRLRGSSPVWCARWVSKWPRWDVAMATSSRRNESVQPGSLPAQ